MAEKDQRNALNTKTLPVPKCVNDVVNDWMDEESQEYLSNAAMNIAHKR